MNWLTPAVATIGAAGIAGVVVVIAAYLKGEWWPGGLRRAKQMSEVLEKLDDPGSAVAKLLARKRDEALATHALKGLSRTSSNLVLLRAYVTYGMILIALGMAGVILATALTALNSRPRDDTSQLLIGTTWVIAFTLGGAGFLIVLITGPLLSRAQRDERWFAWHRARRLGLNLPLSAQVRRHARKDARLLREVRARLRRQRWPFRLFEKRRRARLARESAASGAAPRRGYVPQNRGRVRPRRRVAGPDLSSRER